MNQQLADRLRFLRAFAANPRQVGAILPTSRLAVRDMLDMGDVPGAHLVVELGAGTGSQTGEILARMGPDARLLALEIDPRLARLLEERFDDPRLQVVADSAENLRDHLDGEKADVLVCALPFTSLEPGLRRRILDSLPGVLAADGVALVIQYSPLIQNELRRLFPSVRRRISPLNVPPAFLFACSPKAGAADGQSG
jgi:phospholipid N-methyltransferase